MKAYMSREHIESHLKRLTPKRYNMYQWWRRYESRQELSPKAPLYEKIVHGDYDPSDYLYQMEHEHYLLEDRIKKCKTSEEVHETRQLFMERARRLNEDYQKDEREIHRKLCTDFYKTFGISKSHLEDIMQDFEGTLLDLYNHVKQEYKKQQDEKVQQATDTE